MKAAPETPAPQSSRLSKRLANVAARNQRIHNDFATELAAIPNGNLWARRNIAIANIAKRYCLSELTIANILKLPCSITA